MSSTSGFNSVDELFNHPYFFEEAALFNIISRNNNLSVVISMGLQIYLMKDRITRAKKLWEKVNDFSKDENISLFLSEVVSLKDIISVNQYDESMNRNYPWLIHSNHEIVDHYRHLIDELDHLFSGIWNEYAERTEEWDTDFYDTLLNWGVHDV